MKSPLLQAFLTTSYGTTSERFHLDTLLPPQAAPSWAAGRGGWAVVTAWNPQGTRQDPARNAWAHQALLLATAAMPRLDGVNGDGEWREESVILCGLSLRQAVGLGQQFGQAAVLYGVGRRVALVMLGAEMVVSRRWIVWSWTRP